MNYMSCMFLCMIMFMLFVIAGCGSSVPSWDDYVGAVVEKTFPVPAEAIHSESMLTNSEMRYIQYTFPGFHDEDRIPDQYQQTILDWGWLEKERAETGNTVVYEKGNQLVQITVQENGFTILVPKQDRSLVIQGIESSEFTKERSDGHKQSENSDVNP